MGRGHADEGCVVWFEHVRAAVDREHWVTVEHKDELFERMHMRIDRTTGFQFAGGEARMDGADSRTDVGHAAEASAPPQVRRRLSELTRIETCDVMPVGGRHAADERVASRYAAMPDRRSSVL